MAWTALPWAAAAAICIAAVSGIARTQHRLTVVEGRIDTHDQKFEDRDKLEDERYIDTKGTLVRIEQKLDRVIIHDHS